MPKLSFAKPHSHRTQVLATAKEALSAPDLSTAEQVVKLEACLDQYLQSKADPQVLHKGNKLLLGAFTSLEPPVRQRFQDVLIRAMARRQPIFTSALFLARALNTEALATQRAVEWAKEGRHLKRTEASRLHAEFAQAIHEQRVDDGVAFALAEALSPDDLEVALDYYTGKPGRAFIEKLPQLMRALRESNIGPVGLLDSVLGNAMRPESPHTDPRLQKMQRLLTVCPLTAIDGELARKVSAEAAVDLFSEEEIDAALGYWESPISEAVCDVCEHFNEALKPRLASGDYAEAFARIVGSIEQK